MITIPLTVSDADFQRLNNLFPPNGTSHQRGRRALDLVELYFRSINPEYEFSYPGRGIDLQVSHDGNVIERLEVKGTASEDIAWEQFKVSGQHSYNELIAGLPLYRVVALYTRNPTIHVMTYPEDFRIEQEPRWSIKRPRRT